MFCVGFVCAKHNEPSLLCDRLIEQLGLAPDTLCTMLSGSAGTEGTVLETTRPMPRRACASLKLKPQQQRAMRQQCTRSTPARRLGFLVTRPRAPHSAQTVISAGRRRMVAESRGTHAYQASNGGDNSDRDRRAPRNLIAALSTRSQR